MKLYRNAIRTPDGTVLESFSRHDYIVYTDKNGKEYMVDGGLDYSRRSNHGDEVDLCVPDNGMHLVARHHLTWGTFGKDGNQPYRRVYLKDMSDAHIQAVLDTQHRIDPELRAYMVQELVYRNDMGLNIIED